VSPVVIGLDPSLTSAGVAVIAQHAAPTVRTIGSKGHRAAVIALRSTRIVKQAAAVLACVDPASTLVVIEGPALGLNSPGVWDRAGLWWGIVAGCRSRSVPVAVCAPQTRAKWATGSGRADKTQVLAAMDALWPEVTIRDDNQADALVFASMGAQILGWDVPELDHHRACLAAVAWPQEVSA
jgi:crossover junction endodeoxyribonuclease RuvC